MKTIKKLLPALIVLAALAAGCDMAGLEKPAEPGMGVLRVSLNRGAERTLLPDLYFWPEDYYYTLTFTAVSGAALEQNEVPVNGSIAIGEVSGEFTLAAGTWDLAVKGFMDEAEAGNPGNARVSGEKRGIAISGAGAGAEVSVPLVPLLLNLTQNGTGTLSFSISFPNEVTQASLAVYDGDGALAGFTSFGTNPVNLKSKGNGSITLSSGTYDLGITLYMGGKAVVKGLSAHIYDDNFTFVGYRFTADDFAEFSDAFTSFTLKSENGSYPGGIVQGSKIIVVSVPGDVTALTAESVWTGFSISPDPADVRDYTEPVVYTVGMEDGTPAEYTVYVNSVPSVAALATLLSKAPQNDVDTPIPIKMLSPPSETWAAILSTIGTAGKYVDLDLSVCTMTANAQGIMEFDPGTANTGEKYITGLVLPVTAKAIKGGDYYTSVFQYFTNLKTMRASGVETVGENAFGDCTSLETVDLPQAASIGRYAFRNCTSLASVDLLQAASIGNYAFSNCTSLASVYLPQAVSIGDWGTFSGCTSLETVDLPLVVGLLSPAAFEDCTSLKEVNLPLVEIIGTLAFEGCTSLKTVYLPQAAFIDDIAFRNCTSLASVDLPLAAFIDKGAFYNCTSLETVNLPLATSIEDSAFRIGTGSQPVTGTIKTTITLGATAPTLGVDVATTVPGTSRAITVQVPPDAPIDIYGTRPATFDSTTNNSSVVCWGNGFRGRGWTIDGAFIDYDPLNTDVALTIRDIPEAAE
jgi:hypothetical protein